MDEPAAPVPPCLSELLLPWQKGLLSSGDLACSYVLREAQRLAGPRWRQGARCPVLPCESPWADAQLLSAQRVRRLDASASRGLLAWAERKRPAQLLFHVPTAAEVLALQARGQRCVSLLPPSADVGSHGDVVGFANHDLCHLEKFVDPAHYAGQVGFFSSVAQALASTAWRAYETTLDATWFFDRDRVVADMNGSSIFLFAALKMKLKMAVRRGVAQRLGRPSPTGGPLDPEEIACFRDAMHAFSVALDLPAALYPAAWAVSAKHDCPDQAQRLLRYFEGVGSAALGILNHPREPYEFASPNASSGAAHIRGSLRRKPSV